MASLSNERTAGAGRQVPGPLPGKPPTGFKGEPYTPGIKRDGTPRIVQRWVPDPDTCDLCHHAWEQRVNGASYREVHERTGILGSIGSYATFFRSASLEEWLGQRERERAELQKCPRTDGKGKKAV